MQDITNFDYPSNSRCTCKKTLTQQYFPSTSLKALIPYTKGRWSKLYGLPKETITAIMMLYKNTKVKVRFLDDDTDYFDIIAGVLQVDTLAPYLLIICLERILIK